MNNKLQELEARKRHLNQKIQTISQHFLTSYEEDFAIRFAHESTKMEGNTLSIFEVKTLLVDRITVGGKELRELYEVINHQKAFEYLKSDSRKQRIHRRPNQRSPPDYYGKYFSRGYLSSN